VIHTNAEVVAATPRHVKLGVTYVNSRGLLVTLGDAPARLALLKEPRLAGLLSACQQACLPPVQLRPCRDHGELAAGSGGPRR
jgi:hypothetical protein